MRAVAVILLLIAAGFVVLWQLDLVNIPLTGGGGQGGRVSRDLFKVVETGTLDETLASLEAGGNVLAQDREGQTPLMFSARYNSDENVSLALIDAGADVNATSASNWTPLMFAARENPNPEVVLLLMNAGADPTLRDSEGRSAADHARENRNIRLTRMFRELESLSRRNFDAHWPSGYINPVQDSTFTSRVSHLPNQPRAYRNGVHEGFDFFNGTVSVPVTYGMEVYATARGRVIRADHDYVELSRAEYDALIEDARFSPITPEDTLDKLRGRQVWIEHPGGFVSHYAHLGGVPEELEIGQKVRRGDVVAYIGNSGTVEGADNTKDLPHLHYELWNDDGYMGEDQTPDRIYQLVAQVFGEDVLPPYYDR